MEEDYYLRKFTEKDLDNFENIKRMALSKPYLNDSIDYLLSVKYGFDSYLIRRISANINNGKRKILLPDIRYINKFEAVYEHLDIKERIFITELSVLYKSLTSKLNLRHNYPNTLIKNNYLLEEHKTDQYGRKNFQELKEDNEKDTELIPVPPRCLKKLSKESCEKLIEDGVITEILVETKKERHLSIKVISLMKRKYILTKQNERTISDYFRKYELQLAIKQGQLVVK